LFLCSQKYDSGCSSRTRILTFYPSRIQGSKTPDPGSATLRPAHVVLEAHQRKIMAFRYCYKKRPNPNPQPHLLLVSLTYLHFVGSSEGAGCHLNLVYLVSQIPVCCIRHNRLLTCIFLILICKNLNNGPCPTSRGNRKKKNMKMRVCFNLVVSL
jgi:hypothetical protein